MPSRNWIAPFALAAFLFACEQPTEETAEVAEPAVDVAAEEQALRDLGDRYEQAYNAGDANAVLAMYTSDAILIAHDGTVEPASTGVPNDLAELPPGATLSIDDENISVAASGDLAYNYGTSTVTIPSADGTTITSSVRFLVTFKKDNAEWKASAVMLSAPIAAAGGAAPTTP
jgi:uncharacterized protein (TIGR02246 family)